MQKTLIKFKKVFLRELLVTINLSLKSVLVCQKSGGSAPLLIRIVLASEFHIINIHFANNNYRNPFVLRTWGLPFGAHGIGNRSNASRGIPRHNGTLVKSLDRFGAGETRRIRNFIFGIYYRPDRSQGLRTGQTPGHGAAGLIYRSSTFY